MAVPMPCFKQRIRETICRGAQANTCWALHQHAWMESCCAFLQSLKKVKRARGQKLWDGGRSLWLTVNQFAVNVTELEGCTGPDLLEKMRWRWLQELPGQARYCEIAGQVACNGTLRRAATTKWLRLAPQGVEMVRQMFGSVSWPITSC